MKNSPKHRYAEYFLRHTCKIVLATVLTLVGTSAEFVNTKILSSLVDKLSSKATNLMLFIIILLVLEVASLVCNFLKERIFLSTKASIIRKLHWDLASHLANCSSETVSRTEPVVLSEKLREGNNFISSIYGIYGEIFSLITGVAAFVYTVLYSWQIAVMFIIFFILILVIQYVNIKKMIKHMSKAKTASDMNRQFLVEIVQGFQTIKVQNLVPGLKPHFSQALDSEVDKNQEAEEVVIKNNFVSSAVMIMYKMCFLGMGIYLVHSSELSYGTFVALFMYKNYIYGAVNAILKIAKNKASISTSIQRMDEVFKYQSVSKEKFGTRKLKNPSGNISVKNLTVELGDAKILNNLSLDIPAGKFIGIVGESGCGKSTLLQVLSHQLTPSTGEVLLDGIEISELDEASIRKVITLAPQHPFLFSLTIRQNMLLANPNASDDAIWASLEQTSAAQFVRTKGGLDTLVSPKDLSGGERQRIALARIHLRGGKIILLDESTSALDGNSQEIVLESVQKAVKNGHTIVMVAHRVSTLKNADIIVLMDDGKVQATGTYSELYENNPKFRRLADLG